MANQDIQTRSLALTLGLERLGLAALEHRSVAFLIAVVVTVLAVVGMGRLKVDDSLSELFRTNTPEFRRYEAIDRRFPSSEYDVLLVIEGKSLLGRPEIGAIQRTVVDLQLIEGVSGLVSMLSARDTPDGKGYAAPIIGDPIPEGDAFDAAIRRLRTNEIVAGKFLSDDGQLALAVLSLDREIVAKEGAKPIIGAIEKLAREELGSAGLSVRIAGAPVMQLEIRNAVERDQFVYNGLGLLFGAGIALVFFRSLSLTLLAAIPPALAVVWSLGLLGWLGFKLNLFLNVMTPLVMVMGFADSMQVVSAIRIRLAEGDSPRDALAFAVRVVGPACVLSHAAALVSFLALFTSDSGLIRSFAAAGAVATLVSYVAVIGVMPLIGFVLVRRTGATTATSSDRAMAAVGTLVGWIVDRVVARPGVVTGAGLLLLAIFSWNYLSLEPRYRLADQVPDREQALKATSRLDSKLTGSNPVHVMVEWSDGQALFSAGPMKAIADVHAVVASASGAGLGNVWSLDSLRQWLAKTGDSSTERIQSFVRILPQHLVRRFIAKEETAALVTGRLPDVDASLILPVVDKLDRALDPVRAANPGFTISVTGLPAIAARNSAGMIQQLNHALLVEVILVAVLLGLTFRSWFVGLISMLPGLFPVAATGAFLAVTGQGLEFASITALIIIFGLGVDGLIHFLNRLRREERAGEPPAAAIRRARILVGPAIILTTVVLAIGLGVTIFSDLPSLRLFGIVCVVALFVSLAADLVLLPALIMLYRRLVPVKR